MAGQPRHEGPSVRSLRLMLARPKERIASCAVNFSQPSILRQHHYRSASPAILMMAHPMLQSGATRFSAQLRRRTHLGIITQLGIIVKVRSYRAVGGISD